jgi:hypothetical protein
VSSRHEESALLRSYLLAELPESERLELAARYFSDDDLFERLEAAEMDLIDDYVSGDLSPDDRRLFEESLQVFPGRIDRVAFARALRQVPRENAAVDDSTGERGSRAPSSGAIWGIAAAILLAAAGGVWIARQTAAYESELGRLRAERDRLAQEQRELNARLQELRGRIAALDRTPTLDPSDPLSRVVTFLLTAGLPREAIEGNTLRIPADAAIVRLRLPMETEPSARYRARIQRADGTELLRRTGLRPNRMAQGSVILLEVEARALPEGDYVVLLEDVSGSDPVPVEEYFFRVTRR